MSSDNFERRMEFFLEWQAKFDSEMEELKQRQSVLTDALISLTSVVERHDDHLAILVEEGKKTKASLRELAVERKKTEGTLRELAVERKKTEASLRELAEAGKRTDGRLSALAQAGKETDARLNVLVVTVERYIERR